MAIRKLGLLHTSATLVPIFEQLCKAKLPGVSVFNLVDDSLIKDCIAHGLLRRKRLAALCSTLLRQRMLADYILVTCSSIGAAAETAAGLASVPVLRVDQPMADHAIATARRIGVIATLPTTLKPTADLLGRRAIAAGKDIELTTRLCDGAFDALMGGDPATHDALVRDALRELSTDVEVIALAQASMARVVAGLSEADRRVPILASPPLAIDYLAAVL